MENEKLIYAEKLKLAIRDDPEIDGQNFARMKMHIEEAPTVDAVEVVHGHWISKGYKIECSVCVHRAFLGTNDPVLHTEEKNIRKYCHNCGAKMDGGNEDESS